MSHRDGDEDAGAAGVEVCRHEYDAPTVIRTKRDGGRLSDAAIDWVIDAYTDGQVADEQMSALLMAIFLRGMDRGETARWTAAMLASGERLDFTDLRATAGRCAPSTSTPPAGWATRSRCRWCQCRRVRRRRAAGLGPRARPHRRHPGQAGVHRGLHRDR